MRHHFLALLALTGCSILTTFEPPTTESAAQCTDAVDNDLDGVTDCDDQDCFAVTACVTPEICDDGLDNDGDGDTDCDDANCDSDPACAVEDCDNGADDDGDGDADCDDLDCAKAANCLQNAPPVASDDAFEEIEALVGTEDIPLLIPSDVLLANDSDADGDTLSISPEFSLVSGGIDAVTLTPEGVQVVPSLNFDSVASFQYRALDGISSSAPATVLLRFLPQNDPPVSQDALVQLFEDDPNAAFTLDAFDPENAPVSFILTSQPTNGVLLGNAPDLVYLPDANFFGSDSFTYEVSDGIASAGPFTVTFEVAPLDDPPNALDDLGFATLPNQPLSIAAAELLSNDLDPDSPALRVVSVSPLAGGAVDFDAATEQITFTPDFNFVGEASFTYLITDEVSFDAATVTVSVDSFCGDGILVAGELCDDGNFANNDGCNAACEIETGFSCAGSPSFCLANCGDGLVLGAESCDDGNTAPGDGCDFACQVEIGFACAGAPSACGAVCGDGLLVTGEQCDDLNASAGDGCDGTCQVETGFVCAGTPSVCDGVCGDGLVLGAETCDDANTTNGDGCSGTCAVELGFACAGQPSACTSTCGDGVVASNEGCDDGNLASGDGCESFCQPESGFVCVGSPSTCAPVCGDNIVAGLEQCDDGNTTPDDGCEADCTFACGANVPGVARSALAANGTCYVGIPTKGSWFSAQTFCESQGGYLAVPDTAEENAFIQKARAGQVEAWIGVNDIASEAGTNAGKFIKNTGGNISFNGFAPGDPNNIGGGDDADCAHYGFAEPLWKDFSCTSLSDIQSFVCEIEADSCGDRVVQAGAPFGEQCDDGNAANGDGCAPDCTTEPGFLCTPSSPADGVQNSLCTPICGDGLVVAGEFCDDGNNNDEDGCSAACFEEPGFACAGSPSACTPICGDGLKLGPESCDDGNLTNGDGCDFACQVEIGFTCVGSPSFCGAICGDGLLVTGEQCDDLNASPGDGCDGNCQTEAGFVCAGAPSLCDEVCGDGLVRGAETCDDANTTNGDGCDAVCQTEFGFACNGEPSLCASTCGDGSLDPGEECDDFNLTPGDGCDAACVIEFCSDGIVNGGGGSTPTAVEYIWLATSCTGPQNIRFQSNGALVLETEGDNGSCSCTPGIRSATVTNPAALASFTNGPNSQLVEFNNGIGSAFLAWAVVRISSAQGVQEFVLFDINPEGDAQNRNPDLCNSNFQDGVSNPTVAILNLQGTEECDDFNTIPGDGCNELCRFEFCGDGVVNNSGAESCDDGNVGDGDGCNAFCQFEFCGDGILNNNDTEECDDFNNTDEDGCSAQCVIELCGDGIVQEGLGEQCDDGVDFQINALTAINCQAIEHGPITGDDRGGIAAGLTQVLYNGDGPDGNSNAGRFDLNNLNNNAALGTASLDALTSDIATGKVYVLGNGATPLDTPNNLTLNNTVTSLLEINELTGAIVAQINLSQSIPVTGQCCDGLRQTGIFAGSGIIALHATPDFGNTFRVFEINISTGAVTDHGPAPSLTGKTGCENWATWGVVEKITGGLFLAYSTNTAIQRFQVSTGTFSTLASFTNLSDMCAFTVSPQTNRWYFHHEGTSQFRSGDETIGFCDADLAVSQAGDGCDDFCQIEPGFSCAGEPSVCQPL